MRPDLFDQVSSLLGWERLDQLLFGSGQNALEADHEQIAGQMGVNVLRPPAHILLLEATDAFADSGFDFTLGFHSNIERIPILRWSPTRKIAWPWRQKTGPPLPTDHPSIIS